MQLHQTISVEVVAKLVEGIIFGNDMEKISGVNEIHKVNQGDITFADQNISKRLWLLALL